MLIDRNGQRYFPFMEGYVRNFEYDNLEEGEVMTEPLPNYKQLLFFKDYSNAYKQEIYEDCYSGETCD